MDGNAAVDGELPLEFLKKYIAFARSTCAPRLAQSAGEKLVNQYVRMRNPIVDDQHKQRLLFDFEANYSPFLMIFRRYASSIGNSDHNSSVGSRYSY